MLTGSRLPISFGVRLPCCHCLGQIKTLILLSLARTTNYCHYLKINTMQTFFKIFFIISVVALIVAAVYDYISPGGAAASGVAVRLVLFELRRILTVIMIVLTLIFLIKYGADIQKAKTIIEDVRGLVNSGVKYLEVKNKHHEIY